MSETTVTMSKAAPVDEPGLQAGHACANCGAALAGPYCAQCGQSAETTERPFWEFVEEALESFFHFDSRGLKSLRYLLFQPGRMTVDYLAGRRAAFVPPVRLYILVSVIFFLIVRSTDTAIVQFADFTNTAGLPTIAVRLLQPLDRTPHTPADFDQRVQVLDRGGPAPAWFGRALAGAERAFAEPAILNERLSDLAPKMMIALVPLFALILALVTLRKRRYLVDHLIFSLHFHTFAFALTAASVLVSAMLASWPVGWVTLVLGFAYLLVAFRHMYGDGWVRAAAKTILLVALYGVVFDLALGAVMVAGVIEM